MSTIKSSTTSTTAYQVVADTTGTLVFQTGATPTTALTISTAQVATLVSDAVVNGLTVGRGGAGGVANTAYGASAIPIAPNSGVTAIGSNAGKLFNTASDTGQSTFVGYFAGASCVSGTDNTFIGGSAGTNTTGSKNTAVGSQALQLNTTGLENTAVGYQAGYSNTTGTANVFVGRISGYSNTTANYNNAFGTASLYSNTTGANNVAMGDASLYANTTGSSNTSIGATALRFNTTASNNTAVGYQAGYTNQTGSYNTFMGVSAGRLSNYNGNAFNAAYGYASGYNLSTGINNSFYGTNSGSEVTSGSKNTIIGNYNGNQGSLDIRTASNHIVLSDGDGNPRLYMNGSGNIFWGGIRANAGSYAVKLTTGGEQVFDTSSARYKDNIRDSVYGLNAVMQMRPAQFEYKDDGRSDVGFVAEEMVQVIPEIVVIDKQGRPDAVAYDRITSVLCKAIQELKADLDATKAELAALKGTA